MTTSVSSTISTSIANQLFLSYLGRPADVAWQSSTAAQLNGMAPSAGMLKTFYDLAVAEGVYSASDSSTVLINKIFLNLYGHSATAYEQSAWGSLISNGTIAVEAAAWTLFSSYMGATNVPASYQLPVQSKLIAMEAYTTQLASNTAANAALALGGNAASNAHNWLAAVDGQATAYAKIGTLATDVTAAAGTPATVPTIFTLTKFVDHFVGGTGNDTFNATLDQATPANGTLNDSALDFLTGGSGTDTLHITPIVDVALTSNGAQLSDALFTHIAGIEKIVIDTTGVGAQTITTGSLFNAAFTSGADLATLSTTGAQTVVIATGAATVRATSTTGEQHISGDGIVTVISVSDASTANGGNVFNGASLATVTATSTTGAQHITTGATVGAAHVTMTTGDTAGNVIITGTGNDLIEIIASTVAASTHGNTITGGLGVDTITLAADASINTIVIGNVDSGVTLLTADTINRFTAAHTLLKMGSVGDATAGSGNYVAGVGAVADFAAALVAANTALASLHGTSSATEMYSFQWDATNGYLFNDTNGNGSADQVVVLTGIVGTAISAANIVA